MLLLGNRGLPCDDEFPLSGKPDVLAAPFFLILLPVVFGAVFGAAALQEDGPLVTRSTQSKRFPLIPNKGAFERSAAAACERHRSHASRFPPLPAALAFPEYRQAPFNLWLQLISTLIGQSERWGSANVSQRFSNQHNDNGSGKGDFGGLV